MTDDDMDGEYEIDDSITRLIRSTIKTELRKFASDVAKAAVYHLDESERPYDYGYSVITIRFAEGSEPMAVSIPYLPHHARAEVNLDLKAVKVGTK